MEQQKLWTVVTWHSFELLGHCHEKQPCSRIRTYGICPNHTAVLKKLSLLMRFLESLEWYVALLAKHCGTTAYLLQRTKPVKHPESGECHWISSIGIDLWTIINASLFELLLLESIFGDLKDYLLLLCKPLVTLLYLEMLADPWISMSRHPKNMAPKPYRSQPEKVKCCKR